MFVSPGSRGGRNAARPVPYFGNNGPTLQNSIPLLFQSNTSNGYLVLDTPDVANVNTFYQLGILFPIYFGSRGGIRNNNSDVVIGTHGSSGWSTSFTFSSGNGQFTIGTTGGFLAINSDVFLARVAAGVFQVRGASATGATLAYLPTRATQITTDQNDYNPGNQTAKHVFLNSDASRTITGLTFTATKQDGQQHVIVNNGSNNIVLAHESASSTAANRFTNSTAADITLSANQAADLIYDGTTARWRVFKRN